MAKKIERNQQIMQDLLTMTQAEVSDKYKISRQRVGQIVEAMGGLPEGHVRFIRHAEANKCLGLQQDTKIARQFGMKSEAVAQRRRRLGIEPYYKQRPSHCPRCETNEYAKGYCKNCYNRQLRRKGA